jgi:cysteine desulfurase
MLSLPVYLDNNATTPVDEDVLQSMLPYFTKKFGNAASRTHVFGWIAHEAVEHARLQVASLIGAEPGEITFTSGSTESINLALKGAFESYSKKGNHFITVATEHKAVLDTLAVLEQKGATLTVLPVSRDGIIDLDLLEKSIRRDTIMIAVMSANNETGVMQPVDEIGNIAHSHGVLFFCDATQSAGKSRIDVNEMKADIVCLSAHKIYGPKGTGAIYCRRKSPRVRLAPLIHGGGHESGLRSGTLNVPGIVGFGEACRLAGEKLWQFSSEVSILRTSLEQALTRRQGVAINGSVKDRLPNTTNMCFKGIPAADLVKQLPDLAFSTGSACSSADPGPSHVLIAMGLTKQDAESSVRFSLGRYTTAEEINFAIDRITLFMNKAGNSHSDNFTTRA